MTFKLLQGDCLELLKNLPDNYTEEDVQKYYNGGTSNEHNSTNDSSEQ